MLIKAMGVVAGLLGLAILVFAAFTWLELRSAGASEFAPTADSMPLTRTVYPEFFDSGKGGKPAESVQAAFGRIYIIVGGSLALVVAGIAMLVLPQRPRAGQNSS